MPVTLTSTGITYSNGTSQSSAGAVLGAVQYTAYSAVNIYAGQAFQTSVGDFLATGTNPQYGVATVTTASPTTSVLCGFQAYRSGVANTVTNDGLNDAGTIQRRSVYRAIS